MHYLVMTVIVGGILLGLFNFCRDIIKFKQYPQPSAIEQQDEPCAEAISNVWLVDPKMVISTARGLGSILENLGHFLHIN
jgi:hypothetical protein